MIAHVGRAHPTANLLNNACNLVPNPSGIRLNNAAPLIDLPGAEAALGPTNEKLPMRPLVALPAHDRDVARPGQHGLPGLHHAMACTSASLASGTRVTVSPLSTDS